MRFGSQQVSGPTASAIPKKDKGRLDGRDKKGLDICSIGVVCP